jgi:hypothetical protein
MLLTYLAFYATMANEESGETTVLSGAASNSKSLRATVPIGIVRQFGLHEGDELRWQLKVEKGDMVIVATPIKKDEKK